MSAVKRNFVKVHVSHRRWLISWNMSRLWNRELDRSLVIMLYTKKTTKQRKNKTKSKQTLTSCSRELDERDHSKLEDLWHLLLAKNKTKTILSFSRISTVSSVYKQLVLDYMFCWHNRIKLHCVSKKQDTKLLPITSPNVNRFSKFYHWQNPWQICNKIIFKYSTKP